MSNSTYNPDDNDPAGIREALRRDARRIGEAPFDMALQRETMARIREASKGGRARLRFGFTPASGMASAATVVAVCLVLLLFKPSGDHGPAPVAEVAGLRQVAPRASVLSYERAVAQGDDAFSAALEGDAQALLPSSVKLPDGLL